jgi:hypothetical protein
MQAGLIRAIRGTAGALAVVLAAGCATMGGTAESAVRSRATDNWKARVAGDLDRAYTFMPPSYRALTPVDRYKKAYATAAKLTAAQVADVKCETADKCVATIRIEAMAVMPGMRGSLPPLVTHYEETWIREGGQWWLYDQ